MTKGGFTINYFVWDVLVLVIYVWNIFNNFLKLVLTLILIQYKF